MKLLLKSNFLFTPSFDEVSIFEDSYLFVENGIVVSLSKTRPEIDAEFIDYSDKIIIPGFIDSHLHAPQFCNVGLGYDMQLLPWLNKYTFPEEQKFEDLSYAFRVYSKLIDTMIRNGTTRSVLFASLHRQASSLLMRMLEFAKVGGFVGKVSMDRNSPDFYIETQEEAKQELESFVRSCYNGPNALVNPILTPRFVPTCTPELLSFIGKLSDEFNLPIQSHADENLNEIKWVAALHPESASYVGVYNDYGCLNNRTVLAHVVHPSEHGMELMKQTGAFVAHCPSSNCNLASGMAPIKKLVSNGINVSLGSDISGGHDLSMSKVMTLAVQISKMRAVEDGCPDDILDAFNALYLATKAGGALFGKVGSFEPGYEFDALVIDDSSLTDVNERTIAERAQRFIYCGDDRCIFERYVRGERVELPDWNKFSFGVAEK